MKNWRVYGVLLVLIAGTVSAQGIVNGNFDLGRNNGWGEYSAGNYTVIGTAAFFASSSITPAVTPRSGQYMARIGGFSYDINNVQQVVTLPNTNPLYLKAYVQDRNANTSECGGLFVGAQIRVFIKGQSIYSTYLCQYNEVHTWTPVYFNLSAVAGQTVQIAFQADCANSVWSFLYIDDVSLTNTTGVEKIPERVPAAFALEQNFPNPFNPSTTFRFSLAEGAYTTLTIVDLLGREVATVLSQDLPTGTFNATWDATSSPSGVYIARLHAGTLEASRKIALVK